MRDVKGHADTVRREAMQVLSSASADELSGLLAETGLPVAVETLRGPETGLVAVRGRIGGGGAPFIVGEATVTRASVRLASGEVGHAYALGRDGEKARLTATVDALLQRQEDADFVETRLLTPLRTVQAEKTRRREVETAATKVDFFTMVRGED